MFFEKLNANLKNMVLFAKVVPLVLFLLHRKMKEFGRRIKVKYMNLKESKLLTNGAKSFVVDIY